MAESLEGHTWSLNVCLNGELAPQWGVGTLDGACGLATLDVGAENRGVGQVFGCVPMLFCVVSGCFPLQIFYLLYFYMQTADCSCRDESEVLNAEQYINELFLQVLKAWP